MRFIFAILVVFCILTGCSSTTPPRLQTISEAESDSSTTTLAKIPFTPKEILTDSLSVKPENSHTIITFAVSINDSVYLLQNKDFCYNKSSNEIWLSHEDASNKYTAIPLDGTRVCSQVRNGSKRHYFMRNRALFWPTVLGGAGVLALAPLAGVVWIAASGTAALIVEATGLAAGAIAGIPAAKFFSSEEMGYIRPTYDYCNRYYSEEDLQNWLQDKQCFE